jgi:hypothetical protein
MYSTVEKTVYGFTHLVAFEDTKGNETLTGLSNWETVDSSNRRIYFATSRIQAEKLLKSL